MDKHLLRGRFSRQRKAMDPREAEKKSSVIQKKFLSLELVRKHAFFLIYISLGNEVSTLKILDDLLEKGKKVYAPRCDSKRKGKMDFFRVRSPEELVPGPFGMPEPLPTMKDIFQGRSPAIAAVPGVAFDEHGYRLGYGGGYYDRYFGSLSGPVPISVGLAYEFQIVHTLPADPWDLPMQHIITEKRIINIS